MPWINSVSTGTLAPRTPKSGSGFLVTSPLKRDVRPSTVILSTLWSLLKIIQIFFVTVSNIG